MKPVGSDDSRRVPLLACPAVLIAKVRLAVMKVVLTRLMKTAKRLISCASSDGLLVGERWGLAASIRNEKA